MQMMLLQAQLFLVAQVLKAVLVVKHALDAKVVLRAQAAKAVADAVATNF